MTTKTGFYGSDDTSNKFKGQDGIDYFTLVNKKTGEIEIYQEAFGADKRVGNIGADGKVKYNGNWWGGANNKDKEWVNKNLKTIKDQSQKTIENGLLEDNPGMTPEQARNQAYKLNNTNKSLSSEQEEALTNPTNIDPLKLGKSEPGTRESNFGIHVFPTTLRTGRGGQDFLKIDMMAYKPTGLKGKITSTQDDKGKTTSIQGISSLGVKDRDMDRRSIGTVILPIPGGIQDSQQVTWNDDKLNPFQLAISNVALDAISKGLGEGAGTASELVKSALTSPDTKTALGTYIASQASGAQNLQQRATGAIMNPNMELLFNAPSIRNFSFAFTLAPRSREEAKTVIRIIRFFKQGMAPIRSKSRLFLKSPHTFRLAYKHKALTGDRERDRNLIASQGTNNAATDHPYLNKFKECAMASFGVNYTPNGPYSTYEDGVMTAYNITMNFQELNPIYNDDYGSSGSLPAEIGF